MRGPLRRIDFSAGEIEYPRGYRGQVLYMSENCVIIATLVPPGAEGPPTHIHPDGDQTYFILDGEITIELGTTVEVVPTGSSIYIPRGLTHHNWNDSPRDEIHIEVIAPGSRIRRPLSQPTDKAEVPGLRATIAHLDVDSLRESGRAILTGPSRGSPYAALQVDQYRPLKLPADLQIMSMDRFYLCIEGSLGIQLGLKTHVVEPMTLVAVPAGVPHRCWNPAVDEHRILTITVFDPNDVRDFDLSPRVQLEALD